MKVNVTAVCFDTTSPDFPMLGPRCTPQAREGGMSKHLTGTARLQAAAVRQAVRELDAACIYLARAKNAGEGATLIPLKQRAEELLKDVQQALDEITTVQENA